MIALIVGMVGFYLTRGLMNQNTKGGYFEKEIVYATIENKYIKTQGTGDTRADVYMIDITIFDDMGEVIDSETIKNEDNWFKGKTNAADFQRELKENKCYKLVLYGVRNSMLSEFRNVLEYNEIDCP